MEREGHPAAAATPPRRWADDVIVISSARPAWPSEWPDQGPPPLEKLYFKTKLCDKYESGGRCMYDDNCTFAHGRAELRPPLPPPHPPAAPHGLVWRRPGGTDQEQQRGGGGGGYVKVCHNFRDKGSCHFGDKCAFPHASPAAPAPGGSTGGAIRGPGDQKPVAEARRSATPAATVPRAPGRAYPPVPAAAAARDRLRQMAPEEEGGGSGKVSVLELLALRKTKGIYGDWPEQYS